MDEYTGTMSISPVTCNQRPDFVSIRVREDRSSVEFFEAEVEMAEFGALITGLSGQPIRFQVRGADRLGMDLETKTEFVPCEEYPRHDDNAAKDRALAPFEVEGWSARRSDLGNSHCSSERDGVPGYHVVFRRHVPAKEARDEP